MRVSQIRRLVSFQRVKSTVRMELAVEEAAASLTMPEPEEKIEVSYDPRIPRPLRGILVNWPFRSDARLDAFVAAYRSVEEVETLRRLGRDVQYRPNPGHDHHYWRMGESLRHKIENGTVELMLAGIPSLGFGPCPFTRTAIGIAEDLGLESLGFSVSGPVDHSTF